MRAMVEEAMEAGALGLSTGLYYEPANAAPTEEVIELCRPLAERNGIYCTHMRNEGEHILDSLEETFRVGREANVPVVISHHKVAGKPNHGRSAETLPVIAKAMREQRVALDCYPYHASSTILSASRVANATKVLVTWSKPHPEAAGMDLEEIKNKLNLSVEDLLPAGNLLLDGREGCAAHLGVRAHDDRLRRPAARRGPASAPLGHVPARARALLEDGGTFPLETAIHKMTGLTARTFGLTDRGVLAKGYAADIVIFSAEEVDEAASFSKPIQAAKGIDTVLVNGETVWREGKPSGARPGRVLSRQ